MFVCSIGITKSKMYFQKKAKSRGVHDYGILRAWGVTHSGISEAKGGLKHGSCPWLGMDIFWSCPFSASWCHVLKGR